MATTAPLLILATLSVAIQGCRSSDSNLECEELGAEDCAFAVASSGARCVLEKHVDKNGGVRYVCETSFIMAESGVTDWIESDACIQACGLRRLSIGFSTDELLDKNFIKAICSPGCKNNCPNIMDLYTNLAVEAGVYLPHICDIFDDIGKYVYLEASPKVENINKKQTVKGTGLLPEKEFLSSFSDAITPSLEVPKSLSPQSPSHDTNTQYPTSPSPQHPPLEFPRPTGLPPVPHDYNIEPPYFSPPPFELQPPTYDHIREPHNGEAPPMYNHNVEPSYASQPPMPHYVQSPYMAPPPLDDYNVEPYLTPQSPPNGYYGEPPIYDYYYGVPPTYGGAPLLESPQAPIYIQPEPTLEAPNLSPFYINGL